MSEHIEQIPATPVVPGIAERPPAASGFRERWISTQDNRSLYVREYGPRAGGRTPLLCLPGLTRNCRDFHDLALHLAGERRVVCPDLRGRGRSARETDWRNYRPETLLGDVMHLMAATDLHPAVIIGTSLGGILAMGVAVMRPRALAGVILNDTGPKMEPEGTRFIAAYIAENKAQPSWEAAAHYVRELVGQTWDKDDATWLRIARQSYSEGPDGKLYLDYDPAIARPLRDTMKGGKPSFDLWQLYGGLRHVPALLLRGEHSIVLTDETVAEMIRAKPDLTSVTVAGVGHAPLLDEPEALRAIDAFLSQL